MGFTRDDTRRKILVQPDDLVLKTIEAKLTGTSRFWRYRVFFGDELVDDTEATFEDLDIEDGARLTVDEQVKFVPGIHGPMYILLECEEYGEGQPLEEPTEIQAHRLLPVGFTILSYVKNRPVGAYYDGNVIKGCEEIQGSARNADFEGGVKFSEIPGIQDYARILLKPIRDQ